ncbi:MAG: DNA polymerase III subunit beta [Rhodospirillales bacterium]|nr:DNA polymerase III subunit beta [Rhodospirillales bacterium]
MKLVIERTAFAALLSRVVPGAARNSTIPVWGAVKLTADADGLAAEATDGDRMVSDRAIAEVSRPGITCVEADRLDQIVRALPGGSQVELDMPEGERLTLRSGRSRFTFDTLSPDEFPVFAPMGNATTFALDIPALRHLLRAVRYAVSTEETRYYLCGVYLHVDKGELKACATNAHCLALASIPTPDGAECMPGAILPSPAMDLLLKHLPEKGNVGIEVTDRAMRFTVGDAVWHCKLIDGQFPDYPRVIPKEGPIEVVMEVKAVTAALKRVSLMAHAEEKTRSRSLACEIADGAMTLKARGETGEGEEEVEISLTGAPVTIGFNAAYFIAALEHAGGETCSLRIVDPMCPGVFTNPTDPRGLHIVMPTRV